MSGSVSHLRPRTRGARRAGAANARSGRRPEPRAQLLSAADEVALAIRIERGDSEAKTRMIESNLGLVYAVARSHRGSGVPFADLVQEGTVGLVRAVERFDHRRGVKLSTYAAWWIRRSIREAIAASNVIRIPGKANQQLAAVRRAEAELRRIGPRLASDEAIADRIDLSIATVRSLRSAARVTASLDEPVGEHSTPLVNLLADDHAIDPSATLLADETREELSAMLRLLPERHREVVTRRYGLNQTRVQSHEEIGRWLGVGEERSRQIEREALHRLRSIATNLPRAA